MKHLSRLAFAFAWLLIVLGSPARGSSAGVENAEAFSGTSSCSGRGCHGAITPNDAPALQQNEFATWIRDDKHAHAYEALLSERARRMAENLIPTNEKGKAIPANEDSRCLACHTTPELAVGSEADVRFLYSTLSSHGVRQGSTVLSPSEFTNWRSKGVSCEACHGPANLPDGRWLTAHTTKTWKTIGNAEKSKLGFRNLSDPAILTETCAGCHIGSGPTIFNGLSSPARDLNHDLMAAGHPRLVFELSTFAMNMPPHWRPTKHKEEAGYDGRLWAVGRIEAARAALELLRWRTGEDGDAKRWPEFAEADCFSCHAHLRQHKSDWRTQAGYLDLNIRKPGALPYSVLYSTRLPELALVFGEKDELLRTVFADLGKLIGRQEDNRKTVHERTAKGVELLTTLSRKANAAPYDAAKVKALRMALIGKADRLSALSWDETIQLVYGLAVLSDADKSTPKGVTEQFEKLYKSLAFPRGFESPADFRAKPPDLTGQLKELVDMLGKP